MSQFRFSAFHFGLVIAVVAPALGLLQPVSAGILSKSEFYIKNSDGASQLSSKTLAFDYQPTRVEIDGVQKEVDALVLRDTQLLRELVQDPASIPSDPVLPRELTTLEKAVDIAILVITSMLVMSIHDVYDLGPEFRLSRAQGVVLFIVPFDDAYLYYRCAGKEFLVATSKLPSEKTLQEMKRLEDLPELCGWEPSYRAS
jgi:hypothetical protein